MDTEIVLVVERCSLPARRRERPGSRATTCTAPRGRPRIPGLLRSSRERMARRIAGLLGVEMSRETPHRSLAPGTEEAQRIVAAQSG